MICSGSEAISNNQNYSAKVTNSGETIYTPDESAPDPNSPSNQPTGNPYLDSLIWGGSWNLDTDYGGPSGIITYSFVPYFVSEQEYYEWVDWEKD